VSVGLREFLHSMVLEGSCVVWCWMVPAPLLDGSSTSLCSMVLKCLSIAWSSRVLELYGPQGFMHSLVTTMVHEGSCVVWSISYLASYGPEWYLILMNSCVI
jgi:hypothetical protein